MIKANQEISDKKIVEDILQNSKIIRLAIYDDNVPYIVPFNYGYKENCIYIHSAPVGKKIDLLKKNNRVGFEIEHTARIIEKELACKWSTLYRSIIGQGWVEILVEHGQKVAGLDIIMKHNGFLGKTVYGQKPLDSMVILKLTIENLTAKQSGNWESH
ncbi:MAG: pyridoxamine 5'-phosphate oxidase family protein [Bacteroidales bacterium]